MPEESQEDQFTAEDVETKISEATESLKGEIETLKSQIPKPVTDDDSLPWESDPNWKANDYTTLAKGIEKYLEKQGYSKVDQDQLVEATMTKLKETQAEADTKQKEMVEEANKRIEQDMKEITETLKKEDKELDKDEVFKFINKWNAEHDSKITTFKDGYELYSQQPKPKNDKDKVISGSSTDTKDDKKGPKHYKPGRSPDDVLARVLQDFQE